MRFVQRVLLTPMKVYTTEFLEKIPSVDFCHADTDKTELTYYLFTTSAQTTGVEIFEDSVLSEDDRKYPVKILMHGYTSNVTTPWYQEMKKEYFRKGPHNVIYVDWHIAANKSFVVSAANVKPVGEYIADFVLNLKVPLENVHLIGHSLGAHLAGFVGKNILSKSGQRVFRITATDPAGPGFERVGPESRLGPDDASFVDVIHSDIGYYGIIKPIGHVDFYANGGHSQPGCPSLEDNDNCSHARSNEYFIESIRTKGALAKKAKFNEDRRVVILDKTEEVEFGELMPVNVSGIYYLETNSEAPFLISTKIKNS